MTKYRNHKAMDVLKSPQYLEHVRAMTSEDLHGKAEIAEELAARDLEIERLRAEADENRKLAFFAAQALGSMDTPERWAADKHLVAIIYSGGPQRLIETPNDLAQGEAQGSSRLSPGATGSAATRQQGD